MPESSRQASDRSRARPQQQPSEKRSREKQAAPGPEVGPEMLHYGGETSLAGGFSQSDFERHAALLGDNRLSQPTYAQQRAMIAQQLQRDYGNRYVQRLVNHIQRQREETAQTKLTVGPAGDKYEQEADRVAKQVLGMTSSTIGEPTTQRQGLEEEELQIKAVAQRQLGPEGESIQKADLIQRQERGNLINFRSQSMATGPMVLHHEVTWDSSTGDLSDLAHIETREQVSWDAAPAEFGPSGEYAGSGEHHGLGSNTASGGTAVDDHSIIPTGFNFQLAEDGTSQVWLMNQTYQMQVDGGEWGDVPGGQYQITRWFERKGNDLIAYAAKRGLTDGNMHRAMINVPDWFKNG